MAVRVIRMMEYVYEDLEQAHSDMSRWYVQGSCWPKGPGKLPLITSTTILNPTSFEFVLIKEDNSESKQP